MQIIQDFINFCVEEPIAAIAIVIGAISGYTRGYRSYKSK